MGQAYVANFDGSFGDPVYVLHPDGRFREGLAAVFDMENIPYRMFWDIEHFRCFFGHMPSRFIVAPMHLETECCLDLARMILDRRRGLAVRKQTKVILLGRTLATETREAIRIGVHRVMSWPLDVDELVQIYKSERDGVRELFGPFSLGRLTEREAEITDYLMRGWTHKDIGRRLGIATRTVDAHSQRIRKKLNASSAVALARRVFTG